MLSIIDPENLDWYAVTTAPQKEHVAAYFLRQYGLRTYVPTETRWRRHNRHSRQKSEIAFPVTPRYVFVGVAGEPAWWEIMQVPHVTAVVGIEGKPALFSRKAKKDAGPGEFREWMAVIPNGELRIGAGERRIFVNGRGIFRAPKEQRHMRTHKEFGVGDQVVVVEGPLEGMTFKVEDIKGKNAKVLMPMMMETGLREVSIPLGSLEAAD